MGFSIISIIFLVIISATEFSEGCNKGHHGWGEPVIILPKPTLIPKLKHAFYEGKALVDVHKIIAPSLKPLPYKKGLGFIGKGWLPVNHIHHDYHHHGVGYPFGVGKIGLVGYKGDISYGKGIGWAPAPGPIGPLLDHGHGFHGGHHGQHIPVGPGFPVLHQHHHTVSHGAVTVVDKGAPHFAPPQVPPVPHAFGHNK